MKSGLWIHSLKWNEKFWAGLTELHQRLERHPKGSAVPSYFEAFRKIEKRISLKEKGTTFISEMWESLCFLSLDSWLFWGVGLMDVLIFHAATYIQQDLTILPKVNWIWEEILPCSHIFLFVIFQSPSPPNKYLSSVYCEPDIVLAFVETFLIRLFP